ncbi:hypothetical protein LEP1GSC096_2028 [Leptospira interrogans serovar Hebdomadis str. R499]|nr:hypothetical protein LEP1GSC096_2028 [Leptospira interrogans serovar Hebdomadis str. R499]
MNYSICVLTFLKNSKIGFKKDPQYSKKINFNCKDSGKLD